MNDIETKFIEIICHESDSDLENGVYPEYSLCFTYSVKEYVKAVEEGDDPSSFCTEGFAMLGDDDQANVIFAPDGTVMFFFNYAHIVHRYGMEDIISEYPP